MRNTPPSEWSGLPIGITRFAPDSPRYIFPDNTSFVGAVECDQLRDPVHWIALSNATSKWIHQASPEELLRYKRGEFSDIFSGIDTVSHNELCEYTDKKLMELIFRKNPELKTFYPENAKYSLIFVRNSTDRKWELYVKINGQTFKYLIDESGKAELLSPDAVIADLATQSLIISSQMGATRGQAMKRL